ncbi:putative adipose-regulatory protein-domain-containing protein [Cercophora scortea]|uniref:Adipose-regulatory protein-domain-containing protein n=1 Tax=Cercophora scortea TaxID=314031 RepID=A0AAE0MGT9_9PEZI|nr:putative adipose-regulatory protein-domain-containing protein [Cercophora scortea]
MIGRWAPEDALFGMGPLLETLAECSNQIYELFTSKSTQRTLVNTVLAVITSAFLYGLAVVAYLLFYNGYLPDQVTTVPVHLQYGSWANPYGVASLNTARIKDQQPYDVLVSISLPRSPVNLERGNFMVAIHLLDSPGSSSANPPRPDPLAHIQGSESKKVEAAAAAADRTLVKLEPSPFAYLADRAVLHTSTRPTLLPYTHPLIALASRVLFVAYYLVFPHTETTTLVVPMIERLAFGRGGPVPSSLFIEIQAGQSLQVYSASVTFAAQLTGLRWFMYHYRITAFIYFTASFWAMELVFMAITWLAMSQFVLSNTPLGEDETKSGEKGKVVDGRGAVKAEGDLSDTERTFPSTSKQPALKYEGSAIKLEPGVGEVAESVPGADADDEDDEEAAAAGEVSGSGWRDSGIGTGHSDYASRGDARRRRSGGGKSSRS